MRGTNDEKGRLEGARGVFVAFALMGQWWLSHTVLQVPPLVVAASAGAGIFGAAFALSWAAEAAQLDIPAALSMAFLAFVAVLPEYAVDIYFAWEAGKDPAYVHYAAANMTGANRILIGAGWPLVLIGYWWRSRRSILVLEGQQRTELFYLLLATLYSLVIPLKGTLSPVDSIVLVGLFVAYVVAAGRSEFHEPELEGVALSLAALPTSSRRLATIALFAAAGGTIFIAAEPFAEALLAVGERFGVDEFLLVQWVAPLASEAPEFIVALLFALKLKPNAGFSALVSSKVNQWTLLIGMLPLAFAASAGKLGPMVLDTRQGHEILLTSAQSLFAITVLVDMRFRMVEAAALFVLFVAQLAMPAPAARVAFIWLYFGLSAALVLLRRDTRRSYAFLLRRIPSD